jgi:hypothetical protein
MSPKSAVQLSVLLFFSFAFTSNAVGQRGALTLPRNVAELSSRADTIVRGRILHAEIQPHPKYQSLRTLVVTIAISDALKGSPGKTLQFRQFIWDPRDRADLAGFRRGQEFLLFLNTPTAAGLTSPVGLEQGKFRIVRNAKGEELAVNSYHNSTLFRGVPSLRPTQAMSTRTRSFINAHQGKPGPVPVDILVESARAFARAKEVSQ